ncbi:unnamed protein product [Cylicocyclus nassatus]|uniref:Uncharacterized protein n=1 Tax=Cylicocyclus nassatus TaxID=53992 RepID=A0AA36GZ12_CYLNA|nr:unnamed protein product [Cylicocyclus nassatus]
MWFIINGEPTPTDMVRLSIVLTNGVSASAQAPINSVKAITLRPNEGYTYPKTLEVSPSSALQSYDKTTGKVIIQMTSDVTIHGECVIDIPHTYEELEDFSHTELSEYTHAQLGGETDKNGNMDKIEKALLERCRVSDGLPTTVGIEGDRCFDKTGKCEYIVQDGMWTRMPSVKVVDKLPETAGEGEIFFLYDSE